MKAYYRLRIGAIVLVLVFENVLSLSQAFAAALTHSSILEIGGTSNVNPMIASDGQQLAIDFTPASSSATTASINFNNFSGGSVATSQTATGSGCTTYFPSATAVSGTLSAGGSGTTISISGMTALSSGTNYCLLLTSITAVTNPSSGGVYSAVLTVGSDTQTDAFDVLSAGANAYSVSATITPTFTLSLSGTSDALGTLSSTANKDSTGITATINTNAASGWFLWAKDANGTNGLTSVSSGANIAMVSTGSNHSFTTGTNQYGLGVTVDNTTNYNYGSGANGSGLSNTAFNEIATNSAPASGLTTVLHEIADITATQAPASDYTDTITIVGAGSF